MLNIISSNRTYSKCSGKTLKTPVHVHYTRKRKHAVIDCGCTIKLDCSVVMVARCKPTIQMTTLTINRKCDIDNIFFSQEARSWGYYIFLNGQFFRESGYLTAKIAKRYHTRHLKLLSSKGFL